MPSEYIALPSLILTTALCSGWYLLLFPDPNATKASGDGLLLRRPQVQGPGHKAHRSGLP